jgi:hypothetical protein
MTNRLAMFFGAAFVVVGLAGFVPNPLISSEGLFITNAAHNWTHMLIGAILMFAATASECAAYKAMISFGVFYSLLALIGYAIAGMDGGHAMLFDIIHVNSNDTWLHTLLAAALIGSALASRRHTHHVPAH